MRSIHPNAQFLILKTGSTFSALCAEQGDFEDLIAAGLLRLIPKDLPASQVSVVHIQDETCLASLPMPEACLGLVITGSHAMVTDSAPWMQMATQWLRRLVDAQVPIFGICFGHQLLAHALGGQVGPNPNGLELGTVQIETHAAQQTDPIWCAMPTEFKANAVHYQSVLRLPDQATILASNPHDGHHAYRWRDHVWGVQFHPEFNAQAMATYISQVPHEGQPACDATPDAANLLSRFGQWAIGVSSIAKPTQPA